MFFDLKPPLPNWVGYQCIRHKLNNRKGENNGYHTRYDS